MNKFIEHQARYEEAVRKRVCSKCIDFGQDGVCHGRDFQGCAIFRYLPQLVAIAHETHERSIGPYLRAVREKVCMQCRNPDPDGHCELRDTVNCGLDRYLPLVLEAIEEVDQEVSPE